MNEAALEVRNAAKSGFMILKSCLAESDFERLVLRSTSDKDYSKVLDFLEKESTHSDRFMMTSGNSTKGTFYYNKTRMSKMSKHTSESNDYADLEPTFQATSNSKVGKFTKTNSTSISKKGNSTSTSGYGKSSSNFEVIDSNVMTKFDEIIKSFEDNDWKKRVAGLKALSNFIQEEEKLIKKSKKFFAIIDVFTQWLKDNNSKVVIATQDIFSNLITNIKKMIEKGANQIIEALATNVVSSNSLIKNWGEALMKKLVLWDELECSVFIPPMWNQILQGNSRWKATILEILSEVVEIVYEIKPVTVTRYVYNLWNKLLDDKKIKGDTKKSLNELIGKWYELGGETFITSFPNRSYDKVMDILKHEL